MIMAPRGYVGVLYISPYAGRGGQVGMGDSKYRMLAVGELVKVEAENVLVKQEMREMDDLSDDLERSFRADDTKCFNLSFTGAQFRSLLVTESYSLLVRQAM